MLRSRLERGAEPDAIDNKGMAPRDYALQQGFPAIASMLDGERKPAQNRYLRWVKQAEKAKELMERKKAAKGALPRLTQRRHHSPLHACTLLTVSCALCVLQARCRTS